MAKSKAKKWLEQDKLTLLEAWARDGLTNEQIAHNIGINAKTLYDWIKKESKIGNALKKGKEVVDFEVENALLKKAIGYTITIKEQKLDKYGDIHTLEKDVHIPPDTTAQIFWLKNRKPKEWRDKVINENETKTNGIVNDLVEALNNVKKTK